MSALRRVLPADVYDALELSALAYGGIGAGKFHVWDKRGENVIAPMCAIGHAGWVMDDPLVRGGNEASDALALCGISVGSNDSAVRAFNRSRKRDANARIPFSQWCRELGVERGA